MEENNTMTEEKASDLINEMLEQLAMATMMSGDIMTFGVLTTLKEARENGPEHLEALGMGVAGIVKTILDPMVEGNCSMDEIINELKKKHGVVEESKEQ